MITEKEAKEAIEVLYRLSRGLFNDGTIVFTNNLAIEALRMQIPTRPLIEKWSPARCPHCDTDLSDSCDDGYYVHSTWIKICDCGQKLKWDENY